MLRVRSILGLVVLLGAAAISCAVSLTEAVQLRPDYRYADVAADYEQQRLHDVRPLLPPFTKVEFVNANPFPGRTPPTGYLTQYYLAPAIVVIDGGPQVYVLVDGRPDVEPTLDVTRRLVLVHDAGNGVRLYRGEEP
jgi:hypothetical protein